MKKILKILSVILFVFIVALLVIPTFYKEEIAAFIKEDLNRNFNAQIDYQDVSLSLFRDFPNLHVSVQDISIEGIDDFEGISLASIKNLDLSLNAKKVFFDKDFEINSVFVNQLDLNLLVLENGKVNYNIVKENPADSISSPSSFEIKIKEYELLDATISYLNQLNNMQFSFENIDHSGSGKFTDQAYALQTKTQIENANFEYEVKYINQATLDLTSDILIENDFSKYSFQNNKASINNLDVDVTQSIIELQKDAVFMDIAFQTKNDQLKELLSLVPKTYLTSIEKVDANGIANLKGFVKGIYNENSYPAYEFDMSITDGSIKYPDLPESLKAIHVLAKVAFKGGKNLDNTRIDLPKIRFEVADNTVEGSLKVNNPMSDPLIQTHFKSTLDLNKLQQAVKMANIQDLKGFLDADFSLNGRLSAIEKKDFQNFKASGFFNLTDFSVKSDSIPYDFAISRAMMDLTPEALLVNNITATIGQNDFSLSGKVTNYIAYLLSKDAVLKADFKMHSKFINLNDFMTESQTTSLEKTENTDIVKIPKNLDITFVANAETLQYKDMGLKEIAGKLLLKDEKVKLQAVLLKTLDGQMLLNGEYDSSTEKPVSKMDISMQKMSIVKSATTFSTFQAFAPVLQKVQGEFFSDMTLDMHFDEQMNPLLNTVRADGNFNTSSLQIAGVDILNKIGTLLKIDELKKPDIDKIKAQFSIDQGTMRVNPFGFKLNNMQSSFEGTINLDRQIDFILAIDIPRNKLGANPNALLEGMVGKLADLGLKTDLGDIIKMKFRIKGDYNNPKILPAIAGYEGATTQEIITEVIEDKVEEVVDTSLAKAREEAQKQADQLLAKAQTQADSIVSKAEQLAFKLNQEAQKQGENLIAKATNPFEKIAANTAASQLSKQANKKGVKLVDKAKEKSELLLSKARVKADKLIQTSVKNPTE